MRIADLKPYGCFVENAAGEATNSQAAVSLNHLSRCTPQMGVSSSVPHTVRPWGTRQGELLEGGQMLSK